MTIVVARRQKRITMEGSASSINSRASAIKNVLLNAWRNKLSNDYWESGIRKILPRGVNGDVYDLADCLLKQALVGPVPNQLFISYLKHAVECELVSHSAVLSSIAHQSINIRTLNFSPSRTSSIICLLDFLKTFREKISCKGTEIECLNLCHSLCKLMHWLLKCVQQSLESITGNTNASNPNVAVSSGQTNFAQNELTLGIIDLCTETISYFINRPFTKSLLFISKIEYSQEFDELLKTVQNVQLIYDNCPFLHFINDRIQHFKILQQLERTFNSRDMHPSVVAAQQLRCLQMHRIRSTNLTSSNLDNRLQQSMSERDSTTNYALFNSMYSLIAFDVVLRPSRSHKLLARQLATITNFNSAPIYMAYCELIRVCMIGIIDTDRTTAKVNWAFFTFLKMPKIIIELSKLFMEQLHSHNPRQSSEISVYTTTFINDLKLAFERLCEYSPLLDEAEFKCNCDLFKCLVKELIKNDPNLIQLKNVDFRKFPTKRIIRNNADNPVGGHMILKTEPVVTSMLQTIYTEKDPVELFGILSELVQGKQFEFTLSAAASTGRLQMFVRKLVEHNELNKTPKSDPVNSPLVQALIFDITFLILTYIAQQYGSDVIESSPSTFNKWFYDCYNPSSRMSCPKEMLKDSNGEIVSGLVKQFSHPDSGLQMQGVNWSDVCKNIPNAIFEIINAWNQNYLDEEDIKLITERIKSKMCFVAIVAATWLQCYIRTLNESDKVKPLLFLHSLTKASQQAKQQKQVSSEMGLKSESYSERSSLMCSIIKKIFFELVPKTISPQNTSNNHNTSMTTVASCVDIDESTNELSYHSNNGKFISILSTQEVFLANVKQCLSRGWIDHKSMTSLNSLFKMIGSECFTNLIVEQILTNHESPSDLCRAVNITFSLFHLDIEACAFALLRETVPNWLMGEKKQVLLNQPRAFALAYLTVMTIIEVFDTLDNSQVSNNPVEEIKLVVNGIKQEPGVQKAVRMDLDINGPGEVKRIKLANDSREEKDAIDQDVAQRFDKLNNCITNLMRLFKEIMSDTIMSQRTLFPVLFLQQTVVCTREGSSVITVHLQPEILLDIINLFSSELTFELVLAISNLSSTKSRKYAAKAMCRLAQVKESKKNQCSSLSASSILSKPTLFNPQSSSDNNKAIGGSTPMVLG